MNIAILGATSNIAKDLIFSFVKKNTKFMILPIYFKDIGDFQYYFFSNDAKYFEYKQLP